MKKLLNSVVLFIVAVALAAALFPISFVITFITRLNTAFLSDFFYSLALGIDKVGNVVLQVLLNKFAIVSQKSLKSYRFGNINDTISYALAKNWKVGNLTRLGWLLVNLLEWLDEGHMEKSLKRHY